jgi:membrane peptidoglycan carboxypeptidase
MHPARVIRFRRRRLARTRGRFSMRLRPLGTGLLLAICLALAGALAGLGIAYAEVTRDLPSLAALPALFTPGSGPWLQPTRLYDRSGQHLILALDNPGAPRRYLPLDETQSDGLPASLVRMTLAAKDPNFWTHSGYSLYGILEGAHPTLAQELVSETLLADEPVSLRRSLRERLLAAQITARYGRRQILEWYLNSVDYGHYAVGAEAAAQAFFGKPAHDLNLGEAAVLVAVSNAPALNPIDAPGAGLQLREQMLEWLLANRLISGAELHQALSDPVTFRSPPAADASLAPAFTRLVLSQLGDVVGEARITHGGLMVITTLDLDLQRQALCTVQTHLLRLQGNPKDVSAADGAACQAARLLPTLAPEARDLPQGVSAAAAVLDPQTGELLALTGAATPQRETGSPGEHTPGTLLSPFIYLAGFARGNSPASLVWDLPGGQADLPNPGGKTWGPLRMRSALVSDAWGPAAQLLTELGAQGVWRQAELLGLSAAVSGAGLPGFPLAGGKAGLIEMGQAYGVIANQGVLAGVSGAAGSLHSNTILRVESAGVGRLVDRSAPTTQAVVSAPLAYLLNSVLTDEPARWPTLGFPNDLEIGRPAGARLGRTLTGDAWAVGYTPQRVVTVWLGPPPGSTWKGALDPRLAASLWHALIQWTSRDQPARGWNVPAGVSSERVCDPSGMLPTASCPSVVDEVFLSGNEPTQADTFYQPFQVNRETGRLATVFTPPQLVEQRVYPVLPSAALAWAKRSGLALAPDTYDDIPQQPALADAAISAPAMFGVVHGKLAIRGTASAADLASYRVQVGAGLNPTEWVQVGAEGTSAVSGGTLAQWDTAGLTGLYAVRLLVIHRDQRVETATLQVTVDNTPPKVAVVYPSAGEAFPFPQVKMISLQAQVEDGAGVGRVEWWIDGRLEKTISQAPFSLPYETSAPGKHSVVAKAYDRAGNGTSSEPVTFSFGP